MLLLTVFLLSVSTPNSSVKLSLMGKWAKAAAQPLVPQKNASVFIAAGWCCSKGGTVSKLTFTSDGEKGLENPG